MTVLVLRALGIGDLATSVPAIRGIRAAWPTDRLALAAPAWLAPLIPLIGAVDELAVTPDLGRPPFVPSPEVAVNLHGRGPQSHKLLERLSPRRTLAFNRPEGPIWIDDEHEVARWCRLLRWYGVECDEGDLGLSRPGAASPAPGATVIHAGAKSTARRWNPSRFARVAQALAARGHRVVLTGSDDERPRAEAIAARAGCENLAGRVGLAELAALVCGARLVVSGDTGVAHLATAYGTPSVILFGPMSPLTWGPPQGRPQHEVLWDKETRSLESISVESVLDACERADSATRSARDTSSSIA